MSPQCHGCCERGRDPHIEDYIPWNGVMRILNAYHAYLYPLMPIVHWPTFVQQLVARHDERDRRWRAFVFSLLAYSIVQLPRATLSFLDITECVRLHQECFASSKALQNWSLKDIAIIDIATLYCQHIYLATIMRKHLANTTLTKAIRLSFELKLHLDEPPPGIDSVEQEVRLRIFWLLYGSDRTITVLDESFMLISDGDVTAPYPTAVDDEPVPPGLLDLLNAPSLSSSVFTESFNRILDDLPHELRWQVGTDYTPVGGDGKVGSDAFAICRVNLLITQALIRSAIQQYAFANGEDDAALHVSPRKLVLDMLDSMSTESLTANGDSLRMKVLYFFLSETQQQPGAQDASTTPSYNFELLSQYLRLREQQEANILHEAANSSEGSRAASPSVAPETT
ncbi:uncharacterized protein EHS24_003605 [Apiotrichum porosum]|uniref:Xylanolytic transcriptional activator regulatory domain-containing protein n=1 Tax=Apiotrichum porosum TaxID=105984 RepID=A0A427XEL1_9TREE|nr:uncharacterized protein EHS24_003605 [Apiotrichum porosum]RSH77295.1 hypothetical protein EHS24_003605 [Apiotrichum porosum]